MARLMRDPSMGTGRTTTAMRGAPQGAVFIWPYRSSVEYARALAHYIGRTDLHIVSLSWLEPDQWRGLELTGIVLDHAASEIMKSREWNLYHAAESAIRPAPAQTRQEG